MYVRPTSTRARKPLWVLLTVLALLFSAATAALAFTPAAQDGPVTTAGEAAAQTMSPFALSDPLLVAFTDHAAAGIVLPQAASPSGATIASEYPDYAPGAPVKLIGQGWASGESVHIFVNDNAGQSWSHDSNPDPVADANGYFEYQFTLPDWFVAVYSVTATGTASGTATSSFTDLAIGTYDQCSNDDGDGYAADDAGCRWINGNLQSNNSTYFEGDATVQRVWLTGFLPGSTHTLTLQYGTTKGSKHAYDFLTTWDWSEDWVQEADRCQGITGCVGLSESKLDIPQDPNVPNSFEPSAPGDRQFVMRGGSLTGATTPVIESGSYGGDSETIIKVTFTVANSGTMCADGLCDVALWFGAHVSTQTDWGLGNGAGSISGSPYHVALYRVDDASVGQRDNQMQANAVTPNGTIVIVKDAVPNDAQDFSFNLTNGGTISQNFALDDDADPTLPNSQIFSVPPGIWTASELNIPSGWTLTNLVCVDPSNNTTVNLGAGTATINLASVEAVTCTFTDTKQQNQNLTVSKTAVPSFTRTYAWGIDKNVDQTRIDIAEGGTATFNYTVGVTHDSGADSAFAVSGVITVNNPNAFAVAGVNISDAIDNGGSCSVANGLNVTVPANSSVNRNYTCTFASNPGSGTNTATATWDSAAYYTPAGSANGTAAYNFASVTPTIVNGSVTVSDTLGGNLGTASYTDPSPKNFTYSYSFSGVAGTCTSYPNTASLSGGQSASKSVTVCVGKDLTVTKTAGTAFTRSYAWTINKSVDKTKVILEGANPQSATFNYTIEVNHDSGTDSGWTASGKITVSNPNDWQAISANVTDLVNNGGGAVCTVEGQAVKSVSVPASGSVELNYSCTFSSKPASSGLNTATATWNAATYATPNSSTTGTAAVNFTTPTTIVDGTVNVVDDKTTPPAVVNIGAASYTQANPIKFTYSLTKSGVSGDCTDYTNTATFTTNSTGTTGSDSETVSVCSSNVTVLKLTGIGSGTPAVDPSLNWTFKVFNGPHANAAPGSGSAWLGSPLVSDSTSGDADGILDFDFYNLKPAKTYSLCETQVPSGYTVEWKVDTNGDGTPDTVVIPYNPNEKDAVPEDVGNRCFDFGAGTSYPIPEGGTLAFQVINKFPGGEPRTPGYWKNWNRCTSGGQAANADRNGGRDKGYTLLEDILTSPGITWDDILSDSFTVPINSCEQAVEILDQRVVAVNGKVGDGKKIASDGARTLAMHLLAAQLNQGNGACINQDVKEVMLAGEKLLDTINFDGKKTTAYLTSKSPDYSYALSLAGYLDKYNNSACNFATLPPKPALK